jgi:thiol-disulfide isomerase/thioredoxin
VALFLSGKAMFKLPVMIKKAVLLFFLFATATTLYGKGYKIKVRLAAAADSTVYLTHYYDTKVYVTDTVKADSNGEGVFERDTLLGQGLYKIFMNNNQHFDFLLGADQTMEIINPDFNLDHLQIKDATESVEFLNYMKWMKLQQTKLSRLDSALKIAGNSEKENLGKEIRKLTEEVHNYWKQKSAEYPGTFLSAFLMANYVNDVKEEDIPKNFQVNDSLKWIYQYNFRRNHYFDYFDITDQRFLYTPLIKSKLDTYFDKVLIQMVDSVKPAAYQLINKVELNPLMFRYVASYLLNHSLNSRVMGMDALFVDIARDYYLSGKATWADSATMAVIRENVLFLENNLIGKQARNLQMETFDGDPRSLCQGNSKYTILLFYEPTCSHCKEFVPKMYDEIYLPYRDKGLEVVAIYNQNNRKEWGDFIELHHLNDWVNVWDKYRVTRFQIIYDTRTTPAVYLLDKNKKIVAKKFSIEFLKSFFGFYLDGKKAE